MSIRAEVIRRELEVARQRAEAVLAVINKEIAARSGEYDTFVDHYLSGIQDLSTALARAEMLAYEKLSYA